MERDLSYKKILGSSVQVFSITTHQTVLKHILNPSQTPILPVDMGKRYLAFVIEPIILFGHQS
jgi:hypothetical protein